MVDDDDESIYVRVCVGDFCLTAPFYDTFLCYFISHFILYRQRDLHELTHTHTRLPFIIWDYVIYVV